MSLKDKVEHLSKVKASLQELKQDIEDKDHAQEQKIKARENRLQRVYKKLKGGKIANNERACKCKAHERKTLAQQARLGSNQPQSASSLLPSIAKRESM